MSTTTTNAEGIRASGPELPLLGAVSVAERGGNVVPGTEDEAAARDYRRIADLILHTRRMRRGTIGVLGDVSSHERAAVASGLATALAAESAVVLVDADIDASALALDPAEKIQEGLVDVVRYGVRSPRLVAATKVERLRFLGVGSDTVDVPGTLRSEGMEPLFRELQASCELVIVNGPGPLTIGADGLLPRLDAWVLVRSRTSSRGAWIDLSGLQRERCLGCIDVGTAPPAGGASDADTVEIPVAVLPEPVVAAVEDAGDLLADPYDALVVQDTAAGRGRRLFGVGVTLVAAVGAGLAGWAVLSNFGENEHDRVASNAATTTRPSEAPVEAAPSAAVPAPSGTAAWTHEATRTGAVSPTREKSEPVTPSQPRSNATNANQTAPAKASPVAAVTSGWVVHVSSVKRASGADEESSELGAAGYPTLVKRVEVPGRGQWSRVFLGPYADRAEANRVASEVKSSGLRDYAQVQRRRGGDVPAATTQRPTARPTAPPATSSSPAEPAAHTSPSAAATTSATTKAAEPTVVEKEAPESLPEWIATVDAGSAALDDLGVLEAFPNSSLGRTILYARFSEPRTDEVHVTIHDARGKQLADIDGTLSDGSAMIVWDGSTYDGSVPQPGIYFARLQANETFLSAKFEVE